MEAPNIQLYNLFRLDLRLTDGKSLELMHLLDKEYKSGVKDDLAILDKKIDVNFDTLNKKIGANFDTLDKKINVNFDTLDKKIDTKFDTLDKKIGVNFDTLDKKIDIKVDALENKMVARFEKVDARFEKIENRLNEHDKRFDALENKIEKKGDEVRIGLQHWMIGIILTMISLFVVSLFKK